MHAYIHHLRAFTSTTGRCLTRSAVWEECSSVEEEADLEMRAGDAGSNLFEQRLLHTDKLRWFNHVQNLLDLPQEHHLGSHDRTIYYKHDTTIYFHVSTLGVKSISNQIHEWILNVKIHPKLLTALTNNTTFQPNINLIFYNTSVVTTLLIILLIICYQNQRTVDMQMCYKIIEIFT